MQNILPFLAFIVILIRGAGNNVNVFRAWNAGVRVTVVINSVPSSEHFGTKLVNFLGKCANGDYFASGVHRN